MRVVLELFLELGFRLGLSLFLRLGLGLGILLRLVRFGLGEGIEVDGRRSLGLLSVGAPSASESAEASVRSEAALGWLGAGWAKGCVRAGALARHGR